VAPYGASGGSSNPSRPPAGDEALLTTLGGDGANAVAFATNHRATRPADIEPGDAALHSNGNAEVRCESAGNVKLTAAALGAVHVGGNAAAIVKGQTFNTSHATLLGAISTAMAKLETDPALDSTTKTACGAAVTAIATFLASQASWLSGVGKVGA